MLYIESKMIVCAQINANYAWEIESELEKSLCIK